MPFQKIYAVDFRNGGLYPEWNPYSWPPMQIAPDSINTNHEWTPNGLLFGVRRNTGDKEIRNIITLFPPYGIPMNSRLFIKVTFAHPLAIGQWFTETPEIQKEEAENPKTKRKTERRMNSVIDPQNIDPEAALPYLYPEPWGLGLYFCSKGDLSDNEKYAIISCQFNRNDQSNGIRINTSFALQTDNPAHLESPLDYNQFQDMGPNNTNTTPGSEDFSGELAPEFTLIHSFAGHNLSTINHTVGAGYLKIKRSNKPDSIDHRIYSQKAIADINSMSNTNPVSKPGIKSLGITLGTIKGLGWMRVRLLTFELWWDIGSEPIQPFLHT